MTLRSKEILTQYWKAEHQSAFSQDNINRLHPFGHALPGITLLSDVKGIQAWETERLKLLKESGNLALKQWHTQGLAKIDRNAQARISTALSYIIRSDLEQGLNLNVQFIRDAEIATLAAIPGVTNVSAAFLKEVFGDSREAKDTR